MPNVSLTLSLPHHVVEHLRELAYIDGVGEELERVIIPLIETRFHSRSKDTAEECPWEITLAAQLDYLAIVRRPDTPANREEATHVLEMAALDAVRAERVKQRMPVVLGGGKTLRYRGPKPLRLTLLVRVDNGAPKLVSAKSGGT